MAGKPACNRLSPPLRKKQLNMRRFTRDELRQYNGRDGAPAFIAYQGKIYDVSGSWHWQDGQHQVIHAAGCDLTDALETAPHDADLLDKFPLVGVLIKE